MKDKGSPTFDTPPLVNVGITVTVATKDSGVIFWAINKLITPLPSSVWVKLILSPTTDHSYVVVPPSTVEVNAIGPTSVSWHTTISSIKVTPVIGLTVTVYVYGLPGQTWSPVALGIIV